ncbi:hypothetical protein LWC34_45925 [Kibdelosporangium philippinense]|uniref:Nuclease SbcCD subunit C n=1 Tax=Kibdelosporangium philippinense TaxID=211113 RepID=A0ABS8ZQR3_9PSEU|nr:hypothetical protein [Kibdelosporangium philippinense]MCE7010095.1 hypothetical protein [Kibdelosporangium philippinense]
MNSSAADRPSHQDGSLAARIASRAKTTREDVEDVFTTRGLPLAYPPARPRPVRIHRLRVDGNRVGVQPEGPIDQTFTFNDGLTALVASNLKGKTSVLELITWCLRGAPRAKLQGDVRRWLTRLELDATIAGQPMGFRLSLTPEALLSGVVFTASSVDQLTDTDGIAGGSGVSTLIEADNQDDFAVKVAELMLDRLDLQPIVNKLTTKERVRTQTHGWPSYYSAIYLQLGRDRPLLGNQNMAGLAGRLLQVFLDLPATAVLARVKATYDVLQAEADKQSENTKRAVAERADERARVEEALAEARRSLTQLQKAAPGPDLTELADKSARLARQVADAQDEQDEINRGYREARRIRQLDEKALNDIRESEVARLLFHGLNPSACPRCETPISGDRRQAERDVHRCAVCTTEVTGAEGEDEAVEAEARDRVEGSKAAEKAAKQALGTAEANLDRLTAELETVQANLRTATAATASRDRIAAEIEVARWEGALQVLPNLPDTPTNNGDVTLTVLKSASKVLEDESKGAAAQLFADLNAEIVDLAHQFGMTALESVEINRAAQLKVIKGGGAEKPFVDQDPGAQLRLRVAVIVALLRVGARYGISTHPGLILIDSPKAEEIQDADATVIFRELNRLATAEGLQVLITTADFHLAAETLPAECVIAAKPGDPLW